MFEGSIFGRLDQKLQHAIADAGYEKPTPIQEKAIPPLLEGRDLIGCAQTGTGKTAAFMLPILNRLVKVRRPRRIGHPRALVLSPTRELAVQTAENVRLYSTHAQIPFACVIGGVSQAGQVKDIKRGAETLVACPGRLIDLMTQGIVFLDLVECVVLDEADRMLDMGFLPDVKRIMSKLPPKRQSMLFSATFPPQVRALAASFVQDAVKITISPESPAVEKIDQSVMFVAKSQKDALLQHLLDKHPEWTKVIVFTKMRHGADRIVKKLLRKGEKCAAIHSDKTQNQRTRAIENFKRGENRVLVATDIASRGIDVPEVSCVVNMELPLETENYIHRIGRTARAGESGKAVSFVTPEERGQLKAVERLLGKPIPVDEDNPFKDETPQSAKPAAHCQPQTKWVHPANRNRDKKRRDGRKSFMGRRQPDFGRKRDMDDQT
jgi:ATP-dependent RNA helicase RhlE